jgi:hypothetical protein
MYNIPSFFGFQDAGKILLLLDLYPGASHAYSIRQIRSGYNGPAIQVRRSSDNAVQNIGFVNGEIDTSAILSHCGAGDGFVTIWYDQSGNNNNASEPDALRQFKIVIGGVICTLNGKPSLRSDTTFRRLVVPNLAFSECFISVVFNRTGRDGSLDTIWLFFNSPNNQIYSNSSNWSLFSLVAYNTTIPLSNSQKLISQSDNGTNTELYDNNSLNSTFAVSNNIPASNLYIGGFLVYGSLMNIQEYILYNSSQSSNINNINTNINDYYGIY